MDISSLILSHNAGISESLQRLNDISNKCLYIIDENYKLVGSLTDGDIRRGLLKGFSLNDFVSCVMFKTPVFAKYDIIKSKLYEQMCEKRVESLPIVDDDMKLIDIIVYDRDFDKLQNMSIIKPNKVFILAGGFGVRLEPFTKILPKPLIPLGDKPVLEIIMDKFASYGYKEFLISVNYKGDMIKLYFSDTDVRIKYKKIEYIQESVPLGTIGSLAYAKESLTDTFFISNADIIIDENYNNIMEFHKNSYADMTIIGCLKDSTIPYGVLNIDTSGFLTSITEKPSYNHIINTGAYVAEPSILSYLKQNEKLDMPELIGMLLKDNKKIKIFPISEEQWFDIGQWSEYEKTKKHFN